jgi:hypothetical protein
MRFLISQISWLQVNRFSNKAKAQNSLESIFHLKFSFRVAKHAPAAAHSESVWLGAHEEAHGQRDPFRGGGGWSSWWLTAIVLYTTV